MEVTQLSSLLLGIVMLTSLTVYCDPFCNVCRQDTECFIQSKYKHNKHETYFHLVWRRNSEPVAECFINGDTSCLPYPKYKHYVKNVTINESVISLTLRKTTHILTINADSTLYETWELYKMTNRTGRDQELQYSCTLKIQSKPNVEKCDYKPSKKGLQLICSTSPSYSNIMCKFRAQRNGHQIKIPETVYKHRYKRNKSDLSSITECSVLIAADRVQPGIYKYDVQIFYIFGEKNLSSPIIKKDIEFNVDVPSIALQHCDTPVQIGENINCICMRTDTSDIETTLTWYINNDVHDEKSRTSGLLLSIQMNANHSAFNCAATNKLGWTTFVKYIPNLSSRILKANNGSYLTGCTRDKPYNCRSVCYGDKEFCLNDVVYSCEPKQIQLPESCKLVIENDRDSSYCHSLCNIVGNRFEKDVIFIWIISGLSVLCVGLVFIVCYVCQHRRCKQCTYKFCLPLGCKEKCVKRVGKRPQTQLAKDYSSRPETVNSAGTENLTQPLQEMKKSVTRVGNRPQSLNAKGSFSLPRYVSSSVVENPTQPPQEMKEMIHHSYVNLTKGE